MTVIQFFIIAFALFAISRAIIQFRQGRLPIGWFAFWLLFWILVGITVTLPQVTDIAARLVGVGRGVDFVIYLSLIGLFYLVFRLFIKIEDVEREITRLVRKLAIEDLDKEEE